MKPNNLISLSMGTDKEDKMDLGADATSVGLKALSSLVSPCVSRALARLARRGGMRAQAARIYFYNNAIAFAVYTECCRFSSIHYRLGGICSGEASQNIVTL